MLLPGTITTCQDGLRDGNEAGVDCGGPNCGPCHDSSGGVFLGLSVPVLIAIGCGAVVVLVGVAAGVHCAWRRGGSWGTLDSGCTNTGIRVMPKLRRRMAVRCHGHASPLPVRKYHNSPLVGVWCWTGQHTKRPRANRYPLA